MNENLVAAPVAAKRNATVMVGTSHDPMSGRTLVQSDSFSAVVNLDAPGVFTYPDILAGKLPRHGVAAALPRNVSIPGNTTRFVIGIRIGWPVPQDVEA